MTIATVVADFDALMVSVAEKVEAEYANQRIIGSDYASVYLGTMQSAMQTALGYATTGAEADLLAQKILTEEAQTKNVLSDGTIVYDVGDATYNPGDVSVTTPVGGGVLGKQQILYNKQTDGFDRDAEQKLLKIMNDLYAINMSVTEGLAVPDQNNSTGIDNVISTAKTALGIPINIS